MQTTHQDECYQFIHSISPDINLIYRLNKKLLHKIPETHAFDGPNGALFEEADKSKLFVRTEFQKIIFLKPRSAVLKVRAGAFKPLEKQISPVKFSQLPVRSSTQ